MYFIFVRNELRLKVNFHLLLLSRDLLFSIARGLWACALSCNDRSLAQIINLAILKISWNDSYFLDRQTHVYAFFISQKKWPLLIWILKNWFVHIRYSRVRIYSTWRKWQRWWWSSWSKDHRICRSQWMLFSNQSQILYQNIEFSLRFSFYK